MIKVGIIGYGYWGPNLVRNFVNNKKCQLVCICDLDKKKLKKASKLYPNILATNNYKDIINNNKIDAVVIATPVDTHFKLALSALKSKKHVLVEKPITSSSSQAKILIEEAERQGLTLMVDHTFIYTGAVRKINELVNMKNFGDIKYYDSTRINLGLFQHDVNVLWDLAVHDLSIMSYIIKKKPIAVSANGHSRVSDEPEYAAFLSVYFDDIIAHINVNWLSPVKIRKTLVCGSKKMIVYDDLESIEKVKVYNKGIKVEKSEKEIYKTLISYRTGNMWSPKLSEIEALTIEIDHFINCILKKKKPLSSAEDGLEIVKILELANKSLRQKGKPQYLL